MRIALADGASIKLEGVALVSECKSNFISLGQLQDNRITYHDKDSSMLLMQDGVPIAHARRDQTLFILDLTIPGKIMQTNVATDEHAMMTTRR